MSPDFKEEDFLRPDDSALDNGLPEDLIEEIDSALGEAVLQMDSTPSTATFLEDPIHDTEIHFELDEESMMLHDANFGIGEMQQTLMDMMNMMLRPLARYIKAFQYGEHYEETLDLCDLLITPLIPQLEMAMLTQPMEDLAFFKSVVLFARNEQDPQGRRIMKNVVYRAYKEVQKTFDLRYRGSRKAVQNLISFLQVMRSNPSINEEDIQRFFAIGIPSLTWVRRTSAKELTSLSGIPIGKIGMIRTLAKDQARVAKKNSGSLQLRRTDMLAPVPKQNQPRPNLHIVPDTDPFIVDPSLIDTDKKID
ncbi:MAG: hypothetical protein KDK51_00305 [Deltaproteobacteria bacterium]|nr:hypothetical protein [Deltaproteobacteria bacterium]